MGGAVYAGEVMGEGESGVGVEEGGMCAPALSLGITSAAGRGGGGSVVGYFCVSCAGVSSAGVVCCSGAFVPGLDQFYVGSFDFRNCIYSFFNRWVTGEGECVCVVVDCIRAIREVLCSVVEQGFR